MKKKIIKPRSLRAGDTIGIAAPSSPFDQQAFEGGIRALESMGFQVRIPENLFRKEGYLAGTDAERAELLMQLFCDDSVRAIFCARGGFGSMRLLPLLDFETIRAQPKILVGFSDITALLVAIYDMCGLLTFHGPVVTSLAKGSEKAFAALTDAIASNRPLILKSSNPVVLNPGQASGPVVGGNLTVLTHLIGTPYEPPFEDHIIFLEDRAEAPYRIDRMLSQLSLGGHLDAVAGVLLGSFQDCGPIEDVYAIVKEAFRQSAVPILAGFDLGHGADNLTVPVGLQAAMDTEDGSLRFQEPATSGNGNSSPVKKTF
ncbi:MAG: LD-carboxypeptidase [Deltaproteobacteria bacterium]|nr:LD-carboxypeptidase [Deltaproteobacteria bacterium]